MNLIARLEFELIYDDSATQNFNHYTTRTTPKIVVFYRYHQKKLIKIH